MSDKNWIGHSSGWLEADSCASIQQTKNNKNYFHQNVWQNENNDARLESAFLVIQVIHNLIAHIYYNKTIKLSSSQFHCVWTTRSLSFEKRSLSLSPLNYSGDIFPFVIVRKSTTIQVSRSGFTYKMLQLTRI